MMTKNGIQDHSTFTGKAPRKGMRIPLNKIKYNEQRDSETGYGYFGARYMDHELMTMWLSVDPLADKYPSISPYAYCAWTRPTGGHEHRLIKFNAANNPMKLVDPDGREIQTSSIYPNSTDNIGAVFFSPTGKALATMSMRSIERVVNNRHKARDKHWNQIIKRP